MHCHVCVRHCFSNLIIYRCTLVLLSIWWHGYTYLHIGAVALLVALDTCCTLVLLPIWWHWIHVAQWCCCPFGGIGYMLHSGAGCPFGGIGYMLHSGAACLFGGNGYTWYLTANADCHLVAR